MALDIYLKATYEDGFTLIEDETDVCPFDPTLNFFGGIRNDSPCAAHGPLVQLDLVTPQDTYSLDWTMVPNGAVPVRDKRMQLTTVISQDGSGSVGEPTLTGIDFGYEYPDGDQLIRQVTELR